MGQKVNPIGLRVGITRGWQSKWFANKKEYSDYLHSDLKMRKYIKNKLDFAGISKVEFERAGSKVKVKIYAARPGLIIGRRGAEVDKLKEELMQYANGEVSIDIHEIKNTEIDAQLVAKGIATQLEKRASFRRVMKKAVTSCLASGGLGIKICCSGRLGGAEMARTEEYKEGKVPLHTLRADIDYGFAEAFTTFGAIGVKVWIFKGEIIKGQQVENKEEAPAKKEKPFKKIKTVNKNQAENTENLEEETNDIIKENIKEKKLTKAKIVKKVDTKSKKKEQKE